MKIPFLDLHRQHKNLLFAINEVFEKVILKDTLLGGKAVKSFEDAFARYQGQQHAISCANCTDALEIALRSLNIGEGDEVIVPANGWMSAAEAVCLVNARPVFADNYPDTYTIDVEQIEKKITHRTKAIIPIHLYGFPARMADICALARRHQLYMIEDCAQAHGASIGGKKVGSWGDIGVFSFYPTKNLGAVGDAGAIVTDNTQLADACRQIANHGQLKKNQHNRLGRNSRMDTLQAAVLEHKLSLLDGWNERRRQLATMYRKGLKDLPIQLPVEQADIYQVYHLFVVRTVERDQLAGQLAEMGVGTAVHYPEAVADMQVFEEYKQHNTPIASQQAHQLLSLPLYPELQDEELAYVVECMRKILG